MSLAKHSKQKPSGYQSNNTFIRPSAPQIAQMNKENPNQKVTISNFEPEVKRNHFGEPAFFQPQNTVQARLKTGSENDSKGPEVKAKNETGMPDGLKSGIENLSGEDLSNVRVHRNSSKPEAINAHAYAQGHDIHLAPGQEKHLPHEAWHVVQQRQGRVQPTLQQKGLNINDNAGLEREADVMGDKAVQMKSQDAPTQAKKNRNATRNGVIQRAMKFEWQMTGNHLYRDTGSKVQPLPRKFGPQDYIAKTKSGARFESESRAECEFETPWERSWLKLAKQVTEAQTFVRNINSVKDEKASDNKYYKKFPASHLGLEHLAPGQGFKTSGSRWNKSQETGKRLVTKSVENVRSSPEYKSSDPDFNKIGEVVKGNKLKVKEESSDGKWIKFKSPDIDGWIWKGSTKLETKRYESEPNIDGENIDTELQDHEFLLIKVDDPTWRGDWQVSESFELDQFESYVERDPGVASHAKSYVSTLLAQPIANGASNELKNFLMMVVYFLYRTRHVDLRKNGKPTYAKAAFQLMSRTNFGSVYSSPNLTDKDRTIFNSLVSDKSNGILPTLGLDRSSRVFVHGQKQGLTGAANPTAYYWLSGITQGRDRLSGPTGLVSGAMGKFDMNAEQGKNKNLVRYEHRGPANRTQPVDNWLKFMTEHYIKAMKRRRGTGKGETGLKIW